MTTKDMVNELRSLSAEKLSEKANQAAEELMKLRFRKKTGQLSQTHQLSRARKELARILTVQNDTSSKTGSSKTANQKTGEK
jgi:large subunit ribosomal protein L29